MSLNNWKLSAISKLFLAAWSILIDADGDTSLIARWRNIIIILKAVDFNDRNLNLREFPPFLKLNDYDQSKRSNFLLRLIPWRFNKLRSFLVYREATNFELRFIFPIWKSERKFNLKSSLLPSKIFQIPILKSRGSVLLSNELKSSEINHCVFSDLLFL